MNGRVLFLIFIISTLLGACIKAPVIKGGSYAYIKSNYPIVSLNGNEIEPVYELDIKAGENFLVIVYNTYRHDYYCTFNWIAEAKTAYEVTDQENQYPLTLYRWARTNSLWASRLDPVDPVSCVAQKRQ
jgi:hypothetical protein